MTALVACRTFRSVFCFLLLSFGLLGCAVSSVPTDEHLAPDENSGVMLVSVAYSGRYAGYSLFFRKVGEEDEQRISIGASLLPPMVEDWDIERREVNGERAIRGRIFAIRLPPGEYEFIHWSVSGGPVSTSSSEPFSVRVPIKAGQTTYVGRFRFLATSVFMNSVTGLNLQHSNAWNEDESLIRRKYASRDLGDVHRISDETELTENLGAQGTTEVFLPVVVVN